MEIAGGFVLFTSLASYQERPETERIHDHPLLDVAIPNFPAAEIKTCYACGSLKNSHKTITVHWQKGPDLK